MVFIVEQLNLSGEEVRLSLLNDFGPYKCIQEEVGGGVEKDIKNTIVATYMIIRRFARIYYFI